MTIAAGMLIAGAGLWQISTATTATTYAGIVAGMALLGVGAGLVIPTATASVMGSVPAEHTGVGGGTAGTFLQTGGALGVAVVGSLLSSRYDDHVTSGLASAHLPHAVAQAVQASLGAALGVAHQLGGAIGALIADAARSAFISGMNLGLLTTAIVVIAGAAIALATIPGKAPATRRRHDQRLATNPLSVSARSSTASPPVTRRHDLFQAGSATACLASRFLGG